MKVPPGGLAATNPAVKRLRRLARSARRRREEGLVVVEGPRPVQGALDAGAPVEVVYAETGRAPDLTAALRARGLDVLPVAPGVLERVLTTVSPQPVAALAPRPATDRPPGGPEAGEGPVVVLAGVGDPGNVGTIVRSAVSAGARAVVVGPGSADPFGPKAVRASVGQVFATTLAEIDDLDTGLAQLRATGRRVLGAAPRGGRPHYETDLASPLALVLGGETAGLPAAVADDELVTVVQVGSAESLNVAMAATVLLFEAARQRATGQIP